MKKKVFGRQLSRTKNQRKSLFRGLIISLVQEGEIKTTLAKAKAIRSEAEKLITKAISGKVSDRRVIFQLLTEKALVNKLVDEIAPLFKEKKGGYLKIIHLGTRKGDRAEMAKVMFTEDLEKANKKKPKEKPIEEVQEKNSQKKKINRRSK